MRAHRIGIAVVMVLATSIHRPSHAQQANPPTSGGSEDFRVAVKSGKLSDTMEMQEPGQSILDDGKRRTLRAGRKDKFLHVTIGLEALNLKKLPPIWGVGDMVMGVRIKEKTVVVKDKNGKSSPCLFLGGNVPTPKGEVLVIQTSRGMMLERIAGTDQSAATPLSQPITLVFKVKGDGAPFDLCFVDSEPLRVPLKP